jgi:hypothetical protein
MNWLPVYADRSLEKDEEIGVYRSGHVDSVRLIA